MKLESSHISLQGMRFHAFHGVLPQEQLVGNDYMVDLRVAFDVGRAVLTDDVADTVNYATLHHIVSCEMAQPSRLLEHVAGRIAQAVALAAPAANGVEVKLTKLNPPMGADSDGASVELHYKI